MKLNDKAQASLKEFFFNTYCKDLKGNPALIKYLKFKGKHIDFQLGVFLAYFRSKGYEVEYIQYLHAFHRIRLRLDNKILYLEILREDLTQAIESTLNQLEG